MPTAVILNDTRRGAHPGCTLVMRQLLEGCRTAGITVASAIPPGRLFAARYRRALPGCDLVIINGEGTMHHDSPGAAALAAAGNYAHQRGLPVVLINTVWEGNTTANQLLSRCSLISARESISAEEIRSAGCFASIVPDLVLSLPPDELFSQPADRTKTIVVMDDVRSDVALVLARYAASRGLRFCPMQHRPPLRSPRALMQWFRLFTAGRFARQFTASRVSDLTDVPLIITGRFHGVCLAILARIPFIAVSSNTHKIEGLLADAQLGTCARLLTDEELLPSPSGCIDKAVEQIRNCSTAELQSYRESCRKYSESARRSAAELFREIAAIGRGWNGERA